MNKAAVSYVEREDGKVLCVFNRRYKTWSLPGGKCEQNETLEAAQARELQEETSMTTKSAILVFDAPSCVEVEPDRGRQVYLFRVEAEGTPKENEAGCPVQWMTRDELLEVSGFKEYYQEAFKVVLPKE
jgi:ADP-ribose pyrophosphatase YjhB (NUDIX family)